MKCKICGKEDILGKICPACGNNELCDDYIKQIPAKEDIVKKAFTASKAVENNSASIKSGDILETAEKAMIMILGKIEEGFSKGTGFFVKYEGRLLCLTNYHVVSEAEALFGVFPRKIDPSQEKFEFEILMADDANDIAILELKIDIANIRPLPERRFLELENMNKIKVGDEVFTWGNPKQLNTILVFGRISGMSGADDALQANNNGANKILVNIDATNGNSGGAVCNSAGRVIGMVTSGNDNMPNQVLCNTSFAIEQAIVLYLIKNSFKKQKN